MTQGKTWRNSQTYFSLSVRFWVGGGIIKLILQLYVLYGVLGKFGTMVTTLLS